MATKVVQTPIPKPQFSMGGIVPKTAPTVTANAAYGVAPKAAEPKERAPLDTTKPAVQRSIDRMLVQVYGDLANVPQDDPLKDEYVDSIVRRDWDAMRGARSQILGKAEAKRQADAAAAAAAAASAARRAKIQGANRNTVANAFGFFTDDYFNNLYNQQANRQMGMVDGGARRMARMLQESGYAGSPIGDQFMSELAGLRSSGMAAVDRARDSYISGERSRVDAERNRLGNNDSEEVGSIDAQKQADMLRNNPTDLRIDNPFNDAQRQRWANTLFNGRQVR